MFKWGEYMVPSHKHLVQFASAAALALAVAAPGWAAAPTSQDLAGFQKTDVGGPDSPGSVTSDANGVWTVMGSGNQYQDNSADQFYFIYKAVKGDGSMRLKLIEQAQPGSQYVGPMVRATTDTGSVFAGDVMATGAVNWIWRSATDENATRINGDSSKFHFPKWMMVQRVGNTVQGFESDDGRLWEKVNQTNDLPLDATALIGLALSSRSSDLITAHVSDVQLLEGVTSVTGLEGAATDKVALITWLPISNPNLLGYNVYRGAKGTTLDKMTLLNTSGPLADSSYLDQAAADAPLRSLSYVVAPVFKGTDGNPVEGPAVRAR